MIGFKSSWDRKKEYGSVSEWERSHYGGYGRVLDDYPYINLDHKINLVPSDSLRNNLGYWRAEKIIKLYLLKIQERNLLKSLKAKVIEKKAYSFYSTAKKVISISLDDEELLNRIKAEYPEISPMFAHYKEGLLSSSIEMDLPDPKPGADPEGDTKNPSGPDGNADNSESQGEESEESGDKGEGDTKGIFRILKEIRESKPVTYSSKLSNFDKKVEFRQFDPILKERASTYKFSAEEIKNGESLIKMLDISFEPKSDVVKNLRLGKLDVSKIAEVPAGNSAIYKQTLEDQDTRPFTVCILADLSGSMNGNYRRESQLKVLNSLYLAMSQILPPDKLYIYGHTGEISAQIHTFYSPYDMDYERNITFYYSHISWQQNYDGPVIEAIHKKIRGNLDDRILFISLSDGEPAGNNYGGQIAVEELKRILEKARRDSFVTVGIGIQSDHVKNLYTYSSIVYDLQMMPKDVSMVINKVVRAEFK